MSSHNLLDFMRFERSRTRARFIRSVVLSVGFLSGVSAKLGVSTSGAIQEWLQNVLLTVDSQHAAWIKTAFFVIPILVCFFLIILIYRRAGVWGFIATGMAYVAGLWLNLWSVPLLAVAFLIAIFSVKHERY